MALLATAAPVRAPPDASGAPLTALIEDVRAPQLPAHGDADYPQHTLPKPRVKPIRRIPRASQELTAKKFASIIEAVIANPANIPAWDCLFRFSSRCLRASSWGGRW